MSDIPYARVDESRKSAAQLKQRNATYEAAAQLRKLGFAANVREIFTAGNRDTDAAVITLQLECFTNEPPQVSRRYRSYYRRRCLRSITGTRLSGDRQ